MTLEDTKDIASFIEQNRITSTPGFGCGTVSCTGAVSHSRVQNSINFVDVLSDVADEPRTQTMVSVGASIAGVFFEPLDYVMTGYEIWNNPTDIRSYVGLVPLLPSGDGETIEEFRRHPEPISWWFTQRNDGG
jgi:hypothetical protein